MISEGRPVRYRVELFGLLAVAGIEGIKVRLLDLSESGAFIERVPTEEEVQEGDRVTLTLSFPGIGAWTAAAEVCRLGNSRVELKRQKASNVTTLREGFGIEFSGLEDDTLEQLRDFLDLLDER